ncbi:HEPN domain-containing protein [Tumidithrix elongata RA019]|uniref:HEPN domain-containing protein n=1 Tax=Tumidithrix elongata BACA0141 TaxID=2716417 RepID=A0AAW9Q198_9CYAN|nr:HEPN domain-containing protein [Tumidithrix elongata RA019]
MKLITQEWVDKAEGDFATAQREIQVQQMPNYDAVCFHSQQCVEKYLKACLQEENITFGRTHDLTTLLDALLTVEPSWANLRTTLDALTVYAVEFRYPGVSANQTIASQAFQDCVQIRLIIRQRFALS